MSGRDAFLWPTLVEAERPYLIRFARARLSDADAAEDAVQDALLAALGAAASFKGTASLRTWLTGILNHKIHDAYRRQVAQARRSALPRSARAGEEQDALGAALDREAISDCERHDPLHQLAARRLSRDIESAVAGLPRRQREVFVLADVHGYPTEHVARTVGISIPNVWVTLHRARRVLRERLAPIRP